MNVAVFDTWVRKQEGGLMHFDIVVPTETPNQDVLDYGKAYLSHKGQGSRDLSAKECRFCHIESPGPEIIDSIERQGYHIIEMQGCN
ncbi:MAG: DUF2024 family protein [Bacteroidota bacterium]